jgi:glutamate transport system permease protein
MSASVLYDTPGPRTRRRVWIGSAVATLALLALAALVLARLAAQGQLEAAKWAPLYDPSHPTFATVWRFLRGGLVNTLQAAALAMVLSLVVGTLLAVTRVSAGPTWRWLVVGTIELLRGVPVVMLIFFAARVLPEIGVDLSLMWYLVLGLTAYNAVVIAEIVRAGLASLPRGQTEAAYAVGLTRGQTLRLVLLPQAVRVMLPALISQLVVVLKDTSLGFIISYEELLRRAQIAIQTLQNPLQTFLTVGLIFIVVNYTLSKLAEYVERRMGRAGAVTVTGDEGAEVVESAAPSRTGG